MRVSVVQDAEALRFDFTPEEGDRTGDPGRPAMVGRTATLRVPSLWRLEDVHPDLLGLAALLSVQPFVGERLTLDRPVSSALASATEQSFGIALGPVDEQIVERLREGVPGLAFSGGVDSVAAFAVLPDETVGVFLDRVHPSASPETRSLYRPDAAHHACRVLAKSGRRILRVACDVEFLRSPVGFPVDLSNALPLVVLADLLDLDCVAWGTIAESSYRVGHQRFVDYFDREAFRRWDAIFAAVGLPVMNPVAGVSEVGTSKIVRDAGLLNVAQSCIRGDVGRPCLNCWKCFRKSLLDSALTGDWPTEKGLDGLFAISEAQLQLGKVPIKHENVLAYLLARYEGSHPQMLALAKRVRANELDLRHLERWYEPSSRTWPRKYRAGVQAQLDQWLGRMSHEDEVLFSEWTMDPVTTDADAALTAELYGPLMRGAAAIDVDEPSYYSEGSVLAAEAAESVRDMREKAHRLRRRIARLEQAEPSRRPVALKRGKK